MPKGDEIRRRFSHKKSGIFHQGIPSSTREERENAAKTEAVMAMRAECAQRLGITTEEVYGRLINGDEEIHRHLAKLQTKYGF